MFFNLFPELWENIAIFLFYSVFYRWAFDNDMSNLPINFILLYQSYPLGMFESTYLLLVSFIYFQIHKTPVMILPTVNSADNPCGLL